MISAIFFTSFLWLNFFSNDRWVHLLPRVSHFFSPCPFILISFYNFPAFSGGGGGNFQLLTPHNFFFFSILSYLLQIRRNHSNKTICEAYLNFYSTTFYHQSIITRICLARLHHPFLNTDTLYSVSSR